MSVLTASFISDTLDAKSSASRTDGRSSTSFLQDAHSRTRSGRAGQGSLAFIATITSSMMGSTLTSLPWAFENAGLVASLVMLSLVAAVSYYTCYIILHWGAPPCGNFTDFSDLCENYLGTWSKHVANGTSVLLILGVLAAYHVLMASSLERFVVSVGDMAHYDVKSFFCCGDGDFQYLVSSIIVGVCVFPLMCFKTIDRLMMLGSFGSISLAYNCLFVIGNAIWNWPDEAARSDLKPKMAGDMNDFGVFFGTLGLSLFIHNLLLQASSGHSCIVEKPAVVKRDIAISYGIASTLYIAVGAIPALAFELGATQYQRTASNQLEQNILLAFPHSSWGALIGQLLLTLQIMIVYPLLGTVIRRQFYSSICGVDWPGWPKALAFSSFLVIFTTTISSTFPKPGSVVGIVGVYTAIVYMLGLPILVHLYGNKVSQKGSATSVVFHICILVLMTFAFLLQFIFF